MNKLLKTSRLVERILREYPETRSSDNILYLRCLEEVSPSIHNMTAPYFLCNVKRLNFPYFETVRRARQKVQATYPELKADANVEAVRTEKEKVFRQYAVAEAVVENG